MKRSMLLLFCNFSVDKSRKEFRGFFWRRSKRLRPIKELYVERCSGYMRVGEEPFVFSPEEFLEVCAFLEVWVAAWECGRKKDRFVKN